MSYGQDRGTLQTCRVVDKILKGAKPADLPVEQREVRVSDQSKDGKRNRCADSAAGAGESGQGNSMMRHYEEGRRSSGLPQ